VHFCSMYLECSEVGVNGTNEHNNIRRIVFPESMIIIILGNRKHNKQY
jgi:hypothetical protein